MKLAINFVVLGLGKENSNSPLLSDTVYLEVLGFGFRPSPGFAFPSTQCISDAMGCLKLDNLPTKMTLSNLGRTQSG